MGICFKCAMRFCRSSASGPQGWRGVKLGNQMSTGNKTTVDISSFKMFLKTEFTIGNGCLLLQTWSFKAVCGSQQKTTVSVDYHRSRWKVKNPQENKLLLLAKIEFRQTESIQNKQVFFQVGYPKDLILNHTHIIGTATNVAQSPHMVMTCSRAEIRWLYVSNRPCQWSNFFLGGTLWTFNT